MLHFIVIVVDDLELVHLLFDIRGSQVLLWVAFEVVEFDVFI